MGFGDFPGFPCCQSVQVKVFDSRPDEPPATVVHRPDHFPYLVVFSFGQFYFQPAGENKCRYASYGFGKALGKVRQLGAARLAGIVFPAFHPDGDALPERGERLIADAVIDFHAVSPGMADTSLKKPTRANTPVLA